MKRVYLLLFTLWFEPFLMAQPNNYPNPTPYNFKQFDPSTSNSPTALINLESLVSKSVVYLETSAQDIFGRSTVESTGFFIRTSSEKDYVCLLTAGHVFEDSPVTSGAIAIEGLWTQYKRKDGEVEHYTNNNPNNLTNNPASIKFFHISNLPATLLDWGNTIDRINAKGSDYALLAIPKSEIQSGVEIYEVPYNFTSTLAISSNESESPFSIHHGKHLPQRISELKSVNRINNFDMTSSIDFNGDNYDFWNTMWWCNGGTGGGSSGAPLILPVGGQPMAVGILSGGIDNPRNINIPSEVRTIANQDQSAWLTYFYKISKIQEKIKRYCESDSKKAATGRTYIPNTISISNEVQTFNTQASVLGSTNLFQITEGGVARTFNSFHAGGNVTMSGFQFINANLSLHAKEITLGDGFSIVSDARTSLNIGLENSQIPVASARQAVGVAENVDRSDERVLVFPNPTEGVVNIQPVSDMGLYRIQITDLQGKVVYEEQSQQEGTRHIQLRERNIKAGHYILHILPKDKQASSHSLIVQ